MWIWIQTNWERFFLFVAAFMFLAFSVNFLLESNVAGASAAFAMFFLCLIYGNVSRFKRFKGLGFEAELWEDKQKEAADLIDRLKNIVQVYTREIVMMKVMAGRWSGGSGWPERWALFDELIGQHDTLGQNINFTPLKEKVYRVMVFDAVSHTLTKIQNALSKAHSEASKNIQSEFGSPIKDVSGHSSRLSDLKSIEYNFKNLFEIAETENVAEYALKLVHEAVRGFQEKFGVQVDLPADEMRKLQEIDRLFKVGNFHADPDLIAWADSYE